MIIAWMGYAVFITAMAYLAAAAADYLLWIWRRPRRIAWLAAVAVGVGGPLVIPVWQRTSPTPPIISSLPPTSDPATLTLHSARQAPSGPDLSIAGPDRIWALQLESTLPRIWFGTSALLLLVAVISYARLERQSAAWPEANIDGTHVVVSESRGPAVFGIWRQRIVIPLWALSLEARARALMLQHEREHLRARDSQCLLLAMVTALLFPWNLALWLVVKRLRLTIELDCDDRVLHGDTDARAYGSLLLAVSARRNLDMPFAVALAERSSTLERRIRAMTAVRPRRRLLITMPLLLAVAALTMAATRTPSARAPFFRRQSAVALTPKAITGGARQFPRLATPESLPPISVTWENASIGDVVATFASFAHRRILAASDVNIPITGSVVHEPWFVALEAIMTRNGLRVEVRADSSIYISLPRKAEPRSLHGSGAVQMSRMVRGNIYDAFTGRPIANARINVAGVQLIGEPNETWSNDEGHFSLRVPDGEVWLDASAPGYPTSRIVLAATDTVAVFRERRLDDCLPDTYNADSTGTRELRHEIVPMYSGIFLIDGVPLGSPESRRPQVHCGKSPARTGTVQIRTF